MTARRRGGAAPAAVGLLGAALLYRWVRRRPDDIEGRVVLITGGSRGLGLALADEFARRGCRLALAAREESRLHSVRDSLRSCDVEVEVFPCDVADPQQVESLIADVVARFGRLDILVNNAGIIQVGPYSDMNVEDFRKASDVMFWGPLHTISASLPYFRMQGGGRIVNIASIGGKVSVPHLLPYNCAKFALVGLSEGLRAELANENVSVLTVSPGLMRTGSHLNAWFRGRQDREYAWFGAGATLPLLAMEPRKAAKAIVDGLRRRRSNMVLSLPAKALALAHGVAPETVGAALALGSRLLPRKSAEDRPGGMRRGREIQADSRSGLAESWIERAGQTAVARYQ